MRLEEGERLEEGDEAHDGSLRFVLRRVDEAQEGLDLSFSSSLASKLALGTEARFVPLPPRLYSGSIHVVPIEHSPLLSPFPSSPIPLFFAQINPTSLFFLSPFPLSLAPLLRIPSQLETTSGSTSTLHRHPQPPILVRSTHRSSSRSESSLPSVECYARFGDEGGRGGAGWPARRGGRGGEDDRPRRRTRTYTLLLFKHELRQTHLSTSPAQTQTLPFHLPTPLDPPRMHPPLLPPKNLPLPPLLYSSSRRDVRSRACAEGF